MSGEPFFKMCGSGNDFVFLDSREVDPAPWTAERIARVCARATGVGADGLIFLGPGSGPGTARFTFYNSDGSRGAMCGNGALCATRLSTVIGLAVGGEVSLETDAGVVRGRGDPSGAPKAELWLPDVRDVSFPDIRPAEGESRPGFAVVGVPHLVVPTSRLDDPGLMERGRELRSHRSLGPGGANVNFVSRTGAGWAMRTYERGVEGETLACGTGAVACAAILADSATLSLPWSVRSRSGSTLTVWGEPAPGGQLLGPRLGGEGRLVFRGTLGPDH